MTKTAAITGAASGIGLAAAQRLLALPLIVLSLGVGLFLVSMLMLWLTDALLASFDLDAKADARPGELSQGECSRLAVARALATEAEKAAVDSVLGAAPDGFGDGAHGCAQRR